MQQVWAGTGDGARLVTVPDRATEVVPGVHWGCAYGINTPAYWAVRCNWVDDLPSFSASGTTLLEEIGFCLLGGFGVRYEIAAAAFERLRGHGVFDIGEEVGETDVLELLSRPLDVEGRPQRYRFPRQRAVRLMAARARLSAGGFDRLPALALRDALMSFNGVGPKTASWIVRNHLGSDDVAIIDIHVLRACRGMGLFVGVPSLPRDYATLEAKFLAFARGIGIRPSVLDAVMWSEVRGWRGH